MQYPKPEEIKAASDAITLDGPQSDATFLLCALVIGDEILRDILERMVRLSEVASDAMMRKALMAGCIATGLNYGLRIGEARQDGMRNRSTVQFLIDHLNSGRCDGHPDPATAAEIIKMLEWVLGKRPTP